MTGRTYLIDGTMRTVLKDLGIAPTDATRRAGLCDDLLQQDSVRLAAADYHRLWQGIEAEAGAEAFPIAFCEALRAESFSPPLFAALCSPSLAVAAERVARYKAIVAPMQFVVTAADERLTIALRWSDAVPQPPLSLMMTELLSLVTLARIGTRERICPVDVRAPVPPALPAAYERFLGRPVSPDPCHAISFAMVDARRPFLTSCDTLWNAFEPELRRRLSDLDAADSFTERVRAVLLEGLPAGLVTMEAVARKLAMSKRTLQRRMVAEGVSYQKILNDTREKLARHYLHNTQLSASQISFLLGFTEPNSFHRAFRSWTGMTPEHARHKPAQRH